MLNILFKYSLDFISTFFVTIERRLIFAIGVLYTMRVL